MNFKLANASSLLLIVPDALHNWEHPEEYRPGCAAALVQTTRQVPKLFKHEDLLCAALVMKPLFALTWAWLVYIWFSIFPGSLPHKFLIKLLNSVARSGPSVLWG